MKATAPEPRFAVTFDQGSFGTEEDLERACVRITALLGFAKGLSDVEVATLKPGSLRVMIEERREFWSLGWRLWTTLDSYRSQDARKTPKLWPLHEQLGELLRRMKGAGQ